MNTLLNNLKLFYPLHITIKGVNSKGIKLLCTLFTTKGIFKHYHIS